MAQERLSRRGPPPTNNLEPGWERKLTEQFRQTLSTQRMNELSSRSRSESPFTHASNAPSPFYSDYTQPTPRHGSGHRSQSSPSHIDTFSMGTEPSRPSLRNLPIIPKAPETSTEQRFRSKMLGLSETPCKWENPGLLDEAMKQIPLERLYNEAQEESDVFKATAESAGKRPAWAFQDCVIRALLKWFKKTFFTWVNNPPCSRCGSPTIARGLASPTQEERAFGGNQVESYRCSGHDCGAEERFPRYNDAFVLMQTRRGRLGEWANCFSMLCRAVGSRVRWVWNSEDHVWTEVYSDYRKRWVHVDACEGAFDKPLLYNEGVGWCKPLAYCIAFSADGAMDVTRRYCRNPIKYGKPRDKIPEAVLLFIMDEIRAKRRRDMGKEEKFRLEGEDMREVRELRHYYVSTITAEVAKLIPFPATRRLTASEEADAQKAREAAEELRLRNEAQRSHQH